MNEIQHNGHLNGLLLGSGFNRLQLVLLPSHQHYPGALMLRVSADGFFNGTANHRLGILPHTGPHPFIADRRSLGQIPLVTDNILG